MQPLATGYTPEWGLGAYVAGQNAAMQEANNQEEQIKNYLANQRERQMQPLDVDVRAQEAGLARAKMASPEYNQSMIDQMVGQGKTMKAAGEIAALLQPFKAKAQQAELETASRNYEDLYTLRDTNEKLAQGGTIDDQGILQRFSPQQQQFMQQQRDKLLTNLAQTPEWQGKYLLQQDKGEQNLALQELRNQAALAKIQAAQNKANDIFTNLAAGKLTYEKAAAAFQGLATNEEDPNIRTKYLTLAQQMGQEALRLKNASVQGKTDIEKLTQGEVPTQKATTGMGGASQLSDTDLISKYLK